MNVVQHTLHICLIYKYTGSNKSLDHTASLPHDDVIKWKHFPRNWPFVREIHRSPVNFPHKGQWRGALMFSLIYAWINDWVNNREAGDLRRQHGHYDVIVMSASYCIIAVVLIILPIAMEFVIILCRRGFHNQFLYWSRSCHLLHSFKLDGPHVVRHSEVVLANCG